MTPEDDMLARVELLAVELARLGGAEITGALGTLLSVAYKGGDPAVLRDPVSEVDHRVETLIRARVAEQFPDHDLIGEELDERPGRGHDWVWAVDPIDGTTNFVNGFPLIASSVGVLFRGRPVAGAVWCSTGHRLTAGVYHARRDGVLMFEGAPAAVSVNPAVRRRLGGEPEVHGGAASWDVRKTGSAAIECAFVAVGLLQVARFASPNLWDVAGGLALVAASGGECLERSSEGWRAFESFTADDDDPAAWRRPLILGESVAVQQMRDANA